MDKSNLLVFPALHKKTLTGHRVGFVTELEYFEAHRVKTQKQIDGEEQIFSEPTAIQAYLSDSRYSEKKDESGNYINPIDPDKWSGMVFLDYDIHKEYKHTPFAKELAQKVKKAFIEEPKIRPILKVATTSNSQCGVHLILQFKRERLEPEEYTLFYKALILKIFEFMPDECKPYYDSDFANSRNAQILYQGYDPDIWINPDWQSFDYNNDWFSFCIRPVAIPLVKKYNLDVERTIPTIDPSPYLKNATVISDSRRIPDGFHRKQITNALVHTFGFDLEQVKQFWSNKQTTDGSPVAEGEAKENYWHAVHDGDYSGAGIRLLNRFRLLQDLVINEEAVEMGDKYLTDMNIQLAAGHNLIVSPCGSGKTQYAKTHMNAVIIEPLRNILENNFREVEEVAVSHRRVGSVDIMTYDQFVKRWEEFTDKEYIIFDECHCVDQMFRKKVFPDLIFIIDKLLDMGKTVISLTGTPNIVFRDLWPDAKVFNFKREASPKYEFNFIPVLKKNELFDTCFDIVQRNKADGYASIVFNNNISMNSLLKEQLVATGLDVHTLSAGDREYLNEMNAAKKLGCDCVITTSVMREGSEIKETPDIDNRMFNKEIRCVYIIDAVATKPQDVVQSMNRVRNQSILYCDIIANMSKGLKAKHKKTRSDSQLTIHEKLARMSEHERADLFGDGRTDYEISQIAFYEALCADELYKYQEAKTLWIALQRYGECSRNISEAIDSGIKISRRDRTEEARKLIPFIESQTPDTISRWALGLDLYNVTKDTKTVQFLSKLYKHSVMFNALKEGTTTYSEIEDYMKKDRAMRRVMCSKLLFSMVDFCIRNPKNPSCKQHPVAKWIKAEGLELTGASIDFIKGIYDTLFKANQWFNISDELEGLEYDSVKSVCASLCSTSFQEYLEEKEKIVNDRAERIRQQQKQYNKVNCYKVVQLSDKEFDDLTRKNKLLKTGKTVSRFVVKRTVKSIDNIDNTDFFIDKADADKEARERNKQYTNKKKAI